MSDDPVILPKPDGPLAVRGAVAFVSGGAETRAETLFLCRCGQSANKPFCDGAHRAAGFSSANSEDPPARDRIHSYAGAEMTVHFSARLCSHAAECRRRLPAVFDLDERPWVQPDKGSVDAIKAVIAACPSGALRFGPGGAEQHLTGTTLRITVEPDGPYRVAAVPLLETPLAGAGATAEKYVLCRCGLSRNKPYCDGSHSEQGWKAD